MSKQSILPDPEQSNMGMFSSCVQCENILKKIQVEVSLCEKCSNTEFFLVSIFLHSDWIRRDTEYLPLFSPNVGKYGPEKTPYLDTFHVLSVLITWIFEFYYFMHDVVLVSLLLTLNILCTILSIADFEHITVWWLIRSDNQMNYARAFKNFNKLILPESKSYLICW